MQTTTQELEAAREYALNYFTLHANQRVAVFNYFLLMSGALAAGIAGALQGSPKLALIGAFLGPLVSLLSFVFWKLDQRVSFLIKHAERMLVRIEDAIGIPTARIFGIEPQNTQEAVLHTKSWFKLWTYGDSFRLIFGVMGTLGGAATVVSILKFLGKIGW